MEVTTTTVLGTLLIAEQAKQFADDMLKNDMLSPYGDLLYDCDRYREHLIYTLSFGLTTDRKHMRDMMQIWSAYAGADLRPLQVRPQWCPPGEYYYLDQHPEYTLVWQIEKFRELYGDDAVGVELTPGMQRIQDAIDNGIEAAITAYLEHGISVADLCTGHN